MAVETKRPQREEFSIMKQFPIAIQVYSIRDAAEADFAGTMQALKEMGYSGVELAGTYGMTAVQIKEILDEVGLTLVSAHVGADLMWDDALMADYAATFCGELGILNPGFAPR